MFKNQLEDSPPEYQDMRTNTSSATDIQTDNVEDNKEVHISQLSQLVSELVDGDNLSEFLLDVTFDVEEEENSISQIAERIRDEFAESDGY